MTAATNPLSNLTLEIPFPDITAAHVEPAIFSALSAAEAGLAAIAQPRSTPRTFNDTLGALERATAPLENAMAVVEHLESVASTNELRAAVGVVQPKVSEFWAKLPLNPGLWSALSEFAKTDEAKALTFAQKRLLERTLAQFRRHGAELPPAEKAQLTALDVELGALTKRFAENVLDATHAFELLIQDESELAGLPERAKLAARKDAQEHGHETGYRFTLQAPSLNAALTYLDNAKLRRELYLAHNTRATKAPYDNAELVQKILRLRKDKAKLLGYANFVDLVLEDRMAKSYTTAKAFIADLWERTRDGFSREQDELLAFRRELEGSDAPKLQPWDLAYYAEKQRQARFAFDEEALRPYFSCDLVMKGMSQVVNKLYGITVRPLNLPVWDESVQSYGVYDEDGREMGRFYADLYPRPNKRDGAWMHGLLTGQVSGEDASPHVGVMCANVDPKVASQPALLRHSDVETLFHEFGHLLHHLLSRVDIRSLAGTNVAWDFVELPSQIMENWCWERESLDLFAHHYQSGEPLPESLLASMLKAQTYRAATAMARQLGFATMDLALHSAYDEQRDGDVLAYARDIMAEFTPATLPADYAMIAGFSHLFADPVGYAGGYYSYKWAEVLDADGFSRFAEEGVLSREVGQAFRQHILERGNSHDPLELYQAFRGRPPKLEPLLVRSGLLAPAGTQK